MSSNNNARTGNGRVPVIGPSTVYPVPITLSAAAWKGGIVAGSDGSFYGSNGTAWVEVVNASAVVKLNPPALVTVGAAGDYPTLHAALVVLSGYSPLTPEVGTADFEIATEVRILSGTVMEHPVALSGVNLGWVKITSEDTDVIVVESAMAATPFDALDPNRYAFIHAQRSIVPQIQTHFTFSYASWVGAVGALGQLFIGLFMGGSDVQIPDDTAAPRAGFSYFSYGLFASNSKAVLYKYYGRDCRAANLYVQANGFLNLRYQDIRNSVGNNIRVESFGVLNMLGGDFRKVAGADDSGATSSDVRLGSGASVLVVGNDGGVLAGFNIPKNRFTPAGVVLTSSATTPEVSSGITQPTSYTVATLPSASTYNQHLIHVSNGNSGLPCLAVSNGTSWLRIVPGGAVSA